MLLLPKKYLHRDIKMGFEQKSEYQGLAKQTHKIIHITLNKERKRFGH